MLAYFKGRILSKEKQSILLIHEHIGYEIFVPESILLEYKEEEELALYIYQHQTEQGSSLYGFSCLEDRRFFQLLISVSGVGPKLAMQIQSQMEAASFAQALMEKDTQALTKIKGLGKKGAERLQVELQDKLSLLYDDEPQKSRKQSKNTKMDSSLNEQQKLLLEALMVLGYRQDEVMSLVDAYQMDESLEVNIRQCLQKLRK